MCVFFSVSTKDNCSNNIQTKQNKKREENKKLDKYALFYCKLESIVRRISRLLCDC